jgi:general secretion pathway protein D
VLLGGLIQQAESNTDTGVPGLNRVPVLGRLFGDTRRNRNRTELIVLITPRVIRGGEDAKRVTDDYQSKFESLAPLRATGTAPATGAVATALPEPPRAAATPEQLQQQAVAALARKDYDAAQSLALRSWREGSHAGTLCAQNWQVVGEVRAHFKDASGVDTARKWAQQCVAVAR